MVAHHIGPSPVAAMIRLDALVVLSVALVGMGILLLVAIEHGHALLATGGAIQPRIVALLVILGIHALGILARGAVDGDLDGDGGSATNWLRSEFRRIPLAIELVELNAEYKGFPKGCWCKYR